MWWKKFFLGLTVSATLTSIPGAKAEAAPLSYEEMSLFYDPEGAYGDNLSIPCNTEAYVAVPVIEVYPKSNEEDTNGPYYLPIGEKVTVTRIYRTGDALVEFMDYEGIQPLEYFDSGPVGEEAEAACYVSENTELYLWPEEGADPGGFAVEDQLVKELVNYSNGWSEIECMDAADERLFIESYKLNFGKETNEVYEKGTLVDSNTELYVMP